MRRIAVIGAGPIGLEASLAALGRGYEVALYERGEVAEFVNQWGHVRMFSPFAMNASKLGINKLQALGIELPGAEELLTGREFRDRYLVPLARSFPKEVLHERCEVLAIGRTRALKGDHIGETARGAAPFRLLLQENGNERIAQDDIVFDCSGTYGQPNGLGNGGIPAAGERAAAEHISYGIPELMSDHANERLLVVGAGHSAATAIIRLSNSNARELHWLTRKERDQPLEQIAEDPLPERASLTAAANQLVRDGHVKLHRGGTIEAIEGLDHGLELTISSLTDTRKLMVEKIIVATGFRPDMNLARELQVQTCWATEGTYPLAASLLGETGADCLKTPAFGAEMLMHPEPGYFTLGMKSYGRSPNFLLRTGHEQIATVLGFLDSVTG